MSRPLSATDDAEPVAVADVIEEILFGLRDLRDRAEEPPIAQDEPTNEHRARLDARRQNGGGE